jgi:hypothetical protein
MSTTPTTKSAPLTEEEIKQFAADWYLKLDVHAPYEEIAPMLAEEGLEMRFPEATLRGLDDFKKWYEGVIRIFFDENHNVVTVEPKITGETAEVKVVVAWQASWWKPPAAKATRTSLDAYQRWIMRRSPTTGKPQIVTYIVDSFDYGRGFARL